MFSGINNLTVTISLQLMLKIIINKHFEDGTCIVQFHTNQFYDFSLTNENPVIPQYVNPESCTPACQNYILYDPKQSEEDKRLSECFRYHENYKVKGIILLDHDIIDDYKFSKKIELVSAYAGNSIFISKQNNEFVIEAFDHWYATSHVVLNRWNIIEEKFENESIDEFFSDKRRQRHVGEMAIVTEAERLPFDVSSIRQGSEFNLVVEFAKHTNMKYVIRKSIYEEGKPDVPSIAFELGHFNRPDQFEGIGIYPVSPTDFTFLVTKPKEYISSMSLFEVFSLNLWLLIIVSYLLFALVFWIENTMYGDGSPKFTTVIGMFLLQGLGDQYMPRYLRGRCVLSLMLILTVLYSSVFASGIVDKMMTVSYEGDVNTIEELAKTNYPVYCNEHIFRMRNMGIEFYVHDDPTLTVMERQALQRLERELSPNISSPESYARCHFITQSKLSTKLVPTYSHIQAVNWSSVKSMDDYIFHKMLTSIQLSFSYNHYMLLMPLLAKHLSICNGAGLMVKWEMDAFRAKATMKTIMAALDVKPPASEPSILQFDHIRGVLIVWVVSLVSATLIFLTEQLWVLFTSQIFI